METAHPRNCRFLSLVVVELVLKIVLKKTIRKILVSIKFVSAILGPEMAAPILWIPGKMPAFCRKTSMSIKFLVLGGGGDFGLGGGGKCRFYFYGRGDFSETTTTMPHFQSNRECSPLSSLGLPRGRLIRMDKFRMWKRTQSLGRLHYTRASRNEEV